MGLSMVCIPVLARVDGAVSRSDGGEMFPAVIPFLGQLSLHNRFDNHKDSGFGQRVSAHSPPPGGNLQGALWSQGSR